MILSYIDIPVKEPKTGTVNAVQEALVNNSDRIVTNTEFITQKVTSTRPLEEVSFSEKQDSAYEEKYKQILMQIEKERFERELIAGSR